MPRPPHVARWARTLAAAAAMTAAVATTVPTTTTAPRTSQPAYTASAHPYAPTPASASTRPALSLAPAAWQVAVTGGAVRYDNTAALTTAATLDRSMWVWTTPDPTTLATFAVDHGVSRILLSVPASPTKAQVTYLRSVASQTSARGLSLWALGGDPSWATKPTAALAWQKAALGVGVFAGAHVDVEPYALPAWSTTSGQRQLVAGHLDMLAKLQSASKLPLEADLPFWAGQIPASGSSTWADGVLARTDLVTVMSYRDTAEAMLAVGQDLLERADRAGTRVQLAAETGALADCSYCTFAEEGQDALENALAAVQASASAHRSFAGLAVHHYTTWAALPQ